MRRSRPVSLLLVMIAYFMVVFIKLSPSIVMPSFQNTLGLSSSTVGLISGAYFFSYAFMQLVAGPLCKRIGAVNVIGIGIVVAAFGLLIFGLGNNTFLLFSGRFLLGLGTGPIFVALLFFLQCNYDAQGYVRNYGISVFISNTGSAFSAAPLKLILQYVSIRILFSCLALFSFLIGILFFIFGKVDESEIIENDTSLTKQLSVCTHEIFHDSRLFGSMIIWMLVSGGILAYQGLWCAKWTSSVFSDYQQLSGLGGTLVSLGIMTASLLATRIHRICGSRERTVIISGWLQIIAMLLVTVIKIHDSKAFLLMSFVLDFFFGILMGNVCLQIPPFISEVSKPGSNATIMGIMNFMANLFTQLVQFATGACVDRTGSFSTTFFIMIIVFVAVMGSISVSMMIKRRRLG